MAMTLDFQQNQQEYYDRQHQTLATPKMEDSIRQFYGEKIVAMIDEAGLGGQRIKALEVGVGSGMLMEKIKQRYPHWEFFGVDISERNIRSARERGLNVAVADVEDLHLDETFDMVYGTAILHHLQDIPGFFRNIVKVLKPGGVIIFGAEPECYGWFHIIYHILRGTWAIEKGLLKISSSGVKKDLAPDYVNINIRHHGNPFAYAFRPVGRLWNGLRLSRLPFLNDIYIFAQRKE